MIIQGFRRTLLCRTGGGGVITWVKRKCYDDSEVASWLPEQLIDSWFWKSLTDVKGRWIDKTKDVDDLETLKHNVTTNGSYFFNVNYVKIIS